MSSKIATQFDRNHLKLHQSGQIRSKEYPQFRKVFDILVKELSGKSCEKDPEETKEVYLDSNNNPVESRDTLITWLYPITGSNESSGTDLDPNLEIPNRWLREMFDYNIPGGKLIRGLSLVINYKILKMGYPLMDQQVVVLEQNLGLFQAQLLGWCMEMFQAYFLILDDIMDNSITRRGRPCWYRNEHVGLVACNDSTLIQSSIFQLLYRHLRHHSNYPEIVHLMNEGFRITGYGQCLDILTESQAKDAKSGVHNLSGYTIEKYCSIVKYKTSFYTFVLPTRIAFYLANRTNPHEHRIIETIMTKIGELFQIQDDFLDCYGDPTITGKIGTDIRDAKCSWLVVQALEEASKNSQNGQRIQQILSRHYGSDCDQSEQIIKQLYQELDLESKFRKHENEMLREIIEEIEQLTRDCTGFPVEIFYEPLSHVFKRNK